MHIQHYESFAARSSDEEAATRSAAELRTLFDKLRKEPTLITDCRGKALSPANTVLPCIVKTAIRSLLHPNSPFAMSVLELYYPYYENNCPDYDASFPSYSFETKRSVFRDMQHTMGSLLDSIRVKLTQLEDHAGIAFSDASQDWEEPTLSFSTRILHHLDSAFNSEETPLHETVHIILYLFIATFRELGELLGRFTHQDSYCAEVDSQRRAERSIAANMKSKTKSSAEELLCGCLIQISDTQGIHLSALKTRTKSCDAHSSSSLQTLRDDEAIYVLSGLLASNAHPCPFGRTIPLFRDCDFTHRDSATAREVYRTSVAIEQAFRREIEIPTRSDFFEVDSSDFVPPMSEDMDQDAREKRAEHSVDDHEGHADQESLTHPSQNSDAMSFARSPKPRSAIEQLSASEQNYPIRGRFSCLVSRPTPLTQAELDAVPQG